MENKELLEIFDECMLLEFSISKKDVEGIITASSYTLVEHLIKVLIFGTKCSCYNHWLNEVHSRLRKYNDYTLKPNSKPVPIKYFRDWAESWLDENSYINNIDSVILSEYKFEHVNYDIMKTKYNEFIKLYDSLLLACSKKEYNLNLLKQKIEEFLNNI